MIIRSGFVFYNSSMRVLQTNSKQIDFDVDGQGGNLQQYTITATAPSAPVM